MTVRKIRFKTLSGNVRELPLSGYIAYDIDLQAYLAEGQLETLRSEFNELQGYFERLLDIIEPDLSEAEIEKLCKVSSGYRPSGFEIIEVEEESFEEYEEDLR